MRSRRSSREQVDAEVARRRLELLIAELAEIRPEPAPERLVEGRGRAGTTADPGTSDDPATTGDRAPGGSAGSARVPRAVGAGRHAHRSVGPAGLVCGWVRDRLPPTLQGGAGMSSAHLVVVVALLVVGVLATLWWVNRADGGETALPPVARPASPMVTMPPGPSGAVGSAGPPATATAASRGGASPAPSPASTLVVDVAGKVRHPGIATLPVGARVVDALEAAGGARRGVRLGSLNLARVLTDGEQIVVGLPGPLGVAASAASAPLSEAGGSGTAVATVNVNTARQAELEELPGIGPVTAQAILALRTERGTFTAVDELLEVSGIGEVTLAKIAPYVTL